MTLKEENTMLKLALQKAYKEIENMHGRIVDPQHTIFKNDQESYEKYKSTDCLGSYLKGWFTSETEMILDHIKVNLEKFNIK